MAHKANPQTIDELNDAMVDCLYVIENCERDIKQFENEIEELKSEPNDKWTRHYMREMKIGLKARKSILADNVEMFNRYDAQLNELK